MSVKPVVIIGADWSGDCRRARQFLDKYEIPYNWIDIDGIKTQSRSFWKLTKVFEVSPQFSLKMTPPCLNHPIQPWLLSSV